MWQRAILALAVVLPAALAGCSPGSKSDAQGSLGLAVGATLGPAPTSSAAGTAGEALSHLKSAMITIASVEAHQVDGTWVVIDTGLPATIDLVALLASGGAVPLPADAIPEGRYDALQVAITQVALTSDDGATVTLAPPGTGWTAQIPVDFTVVAGEVTMIQLSVRCDASFQVAGGVFEFDPHLEVEGVVH